MKEQINRAAEFNLDSVIYSSLASLVIRRKTIANRLIESESKETLEEFNNLNNLIKNLLAL